MLGLSDEPTQCTLLSNTSIAYDVYIYAQKLCRPLVFLPSIVSGMPSLGGSYQKALFATLERQLVASLEVSGWCIGLCDVYRQLVIN